LLPLAIFLRWSFAFPKITFPLGLGFESRLDVICPKGIGVLALTEISLIISI
jgi:hypothetical protein